MIKKAILFCENNDKIVDLARFLEKNGWTIYSNGTTAEILKENSISFKIEPAFDNTPRNIIESSNLISKILRTKISSGDSSFETSDEENNYFLVCINFNPMISPFEPIPRIGIGSPALSTYRTTVIRNCSTNFSNVIILTDPEDYKETIIEIRTESVQQSFRMYLAGKALNLVSAYDSENASTILRSNPFSVDRFMNYQILPYKKIWDLPSGANNYQKSAIYTLGNDLGSINGFKVIQGAELSHQTIVDGSFAWDQISSLYDNLKTLSAVKSENCDGYPYTTQFTPLTGTVYTVVVKFHMVVGAALDTSVLSSFRKTLSYDLDSTFNATLACSSVIDENVATEIMKYNFSSLVAPGFTEEARKILSEKGNLCLTIATRPPTNDLSVSLLDGGVVLQTTYKKLFDKWTVPTKTRPTQKLCDELAFGMNLAKAANSYSCVCIKNNAVVGISSGYSSRFKALGSVLYETKQTFKAFPSDDNIIADVLVCDSPIYLSDTIKELIDSGISAILQTGGTEGDKEFIDYCDEHNVAMVFTGMTHINY